MATQDDDMHVEMSDVSGDSSQPQVPLEEFEAKLPTGAALSHAGSPHPAANKNSLCYDIFMPVLVASLFISGLVVILVANNWRANDPYEIAKIYHEKHPFIDGKNHLAYAIKTIFKGDVRKLNLRERNAALSTDLPRLRDGKIGGMMWSAMTPCGLMVGNEGPAAVQRTLYQMDIVAQVVEKYSNTFELINDPAPAREIFLHEKLMPSAISIEGGHQIHEDLAVLRAFRKLGAVSMSLTSDCSISWAETENPYNKQYLSVKGITDFGLTVIDEMNLIGMMVDISLVSESARTIALQRTRSPVIFSQSGASAICNSTFNIPDSLMPTISKNGGVAMVPLFPPAICQFAADLYDRYRSGEINQASLVQQYKEALSENPCGIDQVFAHISHLRSKLGINNIGISTLFEGNLGLTISGLEDMSKMRALSAKFVAAGYTETDVSKIIGGNYLQAWAVNMATSKQIRQEQSESKD